MIRLYLVGPVSFVRVIKFTFVSVQETLHLRRVSVVNPCNDLIVFHVRIILRCFEYSLSMFHSTKMQNIILKLIEFHVKYSKRRK